MRIYEIIDSEYDSLILESLMELDEGILEYIKNPITDFIKAINGIRIKIDRLKDASAMKNAANRMFQEVRSTISGLHSDTLKTKGLKLLNNNFLLSKNYKKTLTILMILKVAFETAAEMVTNAIPGMAIPESAKQAATTFLEGIMKWAGEMTGVALTFSSISGVSSLMSTANAVKKVVVNIDKKLDDLMSDLEPA